jgi:serine protease Do
MPRESDIWVGNDHFRANIRLPDESFVFQMAGSFLEDLERALESRGWEQRRGWIGVVGTEVVDRETARFLGLEGQGALVISEVLPESPAEGGGLQARDILVAINGERIPRLRPDSVIRSYFERMIALAGAGGTLAFDVLRGDEEVALELTPGEVPKRMRDAERSYNDELGLGIRELIMSDSISRRRDHREARGVAVSFIKNNSPAAAASLRVSDWIMEINGEEIADYPQAVSRLAALMEDAAHEEIVLLVLRNNDTMVVRIRKP